MCLPSKAFPPELSLSVGSCLSLHCEFRQQLLLVLLLLTTRGELVLAEPTEHTELRVLAARFPLGTAFLGSILTGRVLTAAWGLLPVAVGCGCVQRSLVGRVYMVSVHMLRKTSLLLLKSKVLRAREVNAFLVPRAEKDEMCLWHLGQCVLGCCIQ